MNGVAKFLFEGGGEMVFPVKCVKGNNTSWIHFSSQGQFICPFDYSTLEINIERVDCPILTVFIDGVFEYAEKIGTSSVIKGFRREVFEVNRRDDGSVSLVRSPAIWFNGGKLNTLIVTKEPKQ